MPLLEQVNFASGRKTRFRDWLMSELRNAEGDRADLVDKWENELELWRAQMPDTTKDFPFAGASNVRYPLASIHTDPVLADLMQTLHASDNFWSAKARRGFSIDQANAVREGLRVVDQDFLGMREVNKRAVLTTAIHGTGIYKGHWVHEQKTVKDYNAAGEIEDMVKTRSQPVIDHVPLQHFWFPPEAWSLRADAQGGAQWLAERIQLTPEQLQLRAESEGLFQPEYDPDAVRFVKEFETSEESDVDEEIREQAEYEPGLNLKIQLFEVWARFDVDGDGIEEDVFVIFHRPTGTILRALHNPFLHGKRPYEAVNYLPAQGILGIGIVEADKWAQKTLTKLINAQIDNVILANTRMFDAPLGSGIQPGEPIYPGKIWLRQQGEQIRPMQAGEVYPSLPQTISLMNEIAEQRTGVSELRQGNVTQLPSRTPASTTLSLLQESSKRFSMILNNMRQPLGRLGLRTLQNLAQYAREDPVRWETYFRNALGEEDASRFMEVLNKPIHNIEDGFDITISATSSRTNREAEKQNFLAMMQVLSQIGAQVIQLGQLIDQSQPGSVTHESAVKMFTGSVELLEQLLTRFDIQNPEEFLPENVANALARRDRAAQDGGGGAQFGPLGGAQGASPFAQAPSQLAQILGVNQ